MSTDSQLISNSSLYIDAHHAFYDYCERALFRIYEVELSSPEGYMLPGLIDAEFRLYKEGKRDIESLHDFLDTLDLDPAISRYMPTVYLASLLLCELMGATDPHGTP
jgi:hypothetical protein